MLDLERPDASVCRIIGLHGGNHAAPFVAQAACLVQIHVMAGGDETTIAGQKRRFRDQGGIERIVHVIMSQKCRARLTQQVGQARHIQHRGQGTCLRQGLPHRAQIARAAPV